MRRIIGLVITASLLVLSCTKGEKSKTDTLIVALGSSPNTLDPRFSTDANGMRIANLMFSSIVRLGPDLKIVGEMAEDWKYENSTYTFRLRPGFKFTDGNAVTADDIRFSILEYKKDKNPFHSALKVIKDVEADYGPQGGTLRLKLSDFSATLLTDLSPVKILPKKIVEEKGDDFNQVLLGSGSFKFLSQSANEIVLAANQDHPLQKPKINRLIFKVIREDNTRYLKTRAGGIDIAQSEIPPGKVQSLESTGKFNVYKYPGNSMSYVLVNLKDENLKSFELRRLIAQAINRDEIIKYKLEGLATPATSILSPANPFFDKSLKNLNYDSGDAKKRLKEMGLEGLQLTLKTSNNQTAVENGKVLQNQLKSIGINLKLQSFEWGTFYGDIKKGNFQLATMRWVGATDPDIYRIAFHSKEHPPGRNRGYYSNPKVDKLVEAGLTIPDLGARISHYLEVQKIVLNELPIIPLWYDTQVAVVHKRVKGYQPPKNGDFSPFASVSKE